MKQLATKEPVEKVESDFERNAKQHGKKYEASACQKFLSRFQHEWFPCGSVDKQFTHSAEFRHTGHQKTFKVGATPDLILWKEEKRALLEIKCPYALWLGAQSIVSMEEAGCLVSHKHYIQCQVQMMVLAIPEVYLFFYIPQRDGSESDNFATFLIQRDQEFQKFILSNIYQAYEELESGDEARFKTIRNEGAHNRVTTCESKREFCKFLIS